MRFRCWLLGHKWASYNIGWLDPETGEPHCWLNDRCVRCAEPRNPIIFYEQERALARYDTVRTGDWRPAMPEPKVTNADVLASKEWARRSAAICVLDDALKDIAAAQYAQAIARGRAAGIEEAAKVCDERDWIVTDGGAYQDGCAAGAAGCAAVIRALKDRP